MCSQNPGFPLQGTDGLWLRSSFLGLPLVGLGESGQNKDIGHEGTVVLCGCGSRIPALALGEREVPRM